MLFARKGFELMPYKVYYKAAGNLELNETEIRELLVRLFYLIKS
jgi:hypothetical protein